MQIKNKVDSGYKGKLEDFNDLQPQGFKSPYHSEITKESILKRGFVQPFAIAKIDGLLYILDGHLRKDLIYELISDGHKVPDELSYYLVDVENNRKKAIDILLSNNLKTNPVNEEYLIEWLEVENIEIEEVNIQSINIVSEYIPEEEEEKQPKEKNINEIKILLTEEESEKWLSKKESLGIMDDKKALLSLIK